MKKAKVCKDPNKEPSPLPHGRCIKKCKEGTLRDPSTGKCVKIPASNPVVSKVPNDVCKELPRTKIKIEKFIKDIKKYKTAKDLIEGYKVDDKDIINVVGQKKILKRNKDLYMRDYGIYVLNLD